MASASARALSHPLGRRPDLRRTVCGEAGVSGRHEDNITRNVAPQTPRRTTFEDSQRIWSGRGAKREAVGQAPRRSFVSNSTFCANSCFHPTHQTLCFACGVISAEEKVMTSLSAGLIRGLAGLALSFVRDRDSPMDGCIRENGMD
jgi:hypothetical protein